MSVLGPCHDCISGLIAPRCRSLSPTILITRAPSRPPVTPTIGLRSALRVETGRQRQRPRHVPRHSRREPLVCIRTSSCLSTTQTWPAPRQGCRGPWETSTTPPPSYTLPPYPSLLQSTAHIYPRYPGRLTTHPLPTHSRSQPINLKQGPPGQPKRRHRATRRISSQGRNRSARSIYTVHTANTACRSSIANTQSPTHDALRSGDRHSASRQQV